MACHMFFIYKVWELVVSLDGNGGDAVGRMCTINPIQLGDVVAILPLPIAAALGVAEVEDPPQYNKEMPCVLLHCCMHDLRYGLKVEPSRDNIEA